MNAAILSSISDRPGQRVKNRAWSRSGAWSRMDNRTRWRLWSVAESESTYIPNQFTERSWSESRMWPEVRSWSKYGDD